MTAIEISYLTIKGIRVHPEVWEERAVQRCDLEVCRGRCCSRGVWIDLAQSERIMAMAEQLKPLLTPYLQDEQLWFDGIKKEDPDYPSGFCTGTQTAVNDAGEQSCVFLRGGRCQLQSLGVAQGLGRWELKPFYCILYPLTLEQGVLRIDHEHAVLLGYDCQRPAAEKRPFFQTFRDEVELALGPDGFAELEEAVRRRQKTERAG